MKKFLPFAAALALVAGCSPSLSRPERSFTTGAPPAWNAGVAAPDAPVERWWHYIEDPGLAQVVEETLARNADLRAAAARIDAARAQARIAGAAELPLVEASFNRTRQRFNFIGLPVPGGGSTILKSFNTTIGPSFNLSWEPDVWGRIKSGKLAAFADFEASRSDLSATRLSLSGQTAKAWFAAVEADRQVGLAKASLESFKASAARVKARYFSGVRPSLDLRLALTEVERAESLLAQRRQQRDAAVRSLEVLMGYYPDGEYPLAEDLPETTPHVPAGLPSELVHRRPDLLAAERRLLAADARIATAKAELRPRFDLTGSAGTATNQFSQVLSGEVLVWSLFTGVTQPLFNNGRLKAQVGQNQALAEEAAANYEAAMMMAYGEVETALAADAYLASQEKFLAEATKQALAAQSLAEDRYRSGLSDIITVLQSQRTALDSESALLTARRSRLDNRVDLHLALGGGFGNDN